MELASLLPPAEFSLLHDWKRHLFADAASCSSSLNESVGVPTVPHCDRELFRSPRSYGDFLTRLYDCNMIRFDLYEGEPHNMGIFFVKKKSGQLRIIFDTRRLNEQFVAPPKTALPTAASMSAIECDPDEDLVIASGDISNAFYGMSVPTSLSKLFTLPKIEGKYLADSLRVKLCLGRDQVVVARLCVLPMGWNWSLHFCQRAVASLVESIVPDGVMIQDKSASILLRPEGKRGGGPPGFLCCLCCWGGVCRQLCCFGNLQENGQLSF